MMVPGGRDHVFLGDVRDVAMLCLRAAWPEAVVDEGDRDGEMFVYRDPAAREAWRNDGATMANAPTMVHILAGAESTTIVTREELRVFDTNPSVWTTARPRESCLRCKHWWHRRDLCTAAVPSPQPGRGWNYPSTKPAWCPGFEAETNCHNCGRDLSGPVTDGGDCRHCLVIVDLDAADAIAALPKATLRAPIDALTEEVTLSSGLATEEEDS